MDVIWTSGRGRGLEGGFGDERLWEICGGAGGGAGQVKRGIIQTLSCNLSFGLGYGS